MPSFAEVSEPVDVALVALPAALVSATLRACAAKGVKSCIVFSSGFAEEDAAGAARQAGIEALCRETGMRVIGPNCLGCFNVETGFTATFSTTLDRGPPKPGGLAIASQSSAPAGSVQDLSHIGFGGLFHQAPLSRCLSRSLFM